MTSGWLAAAPSAGASRGARGAFVEARSFFAQRRRRGQMTPVSPPDSLFEGSTQLGTRTSTWGSLKRGAKSGARVVRCFVSGWAPRALH